MSSEERKSTENLQAEIVIVGGGGAGMAAALTATEKGCTNIIVIEKAGSPGGNSAMAHDLFGTESPVQIQMGIDATRDHFFKVAMQWSHWSKVNPRIVRAFIDKSGDTIRWLQTKGIHFEMGQYYINQSPRIRHCIEGEGAELMRVLTKNCKEKGVQIFTHTRATKLICGSNGNVTGVIAKTKEHDIQINTKAVIISSGGHGENKELLHKYCSYYNPDIVINDGVKSNTGDGIFLATEIGAATAGLGHIMFRGPVSCSDNPLLLFLGEKEEFKITLGALVWEPQTLWINKNGKRFIDEGFNLASFASANAVAQQPGGIMFSIFDDATRQSIEEKGLIRPGAYGGQIGGRFKRPVAGTPVPGLAKSLTEKSEKDTTVRITNSLDEIAQWIGVKPEILKTTIEEYNSGCDTGYDSIFCKDRRYLRPIRKAPFYAVKGRSTICDAIGGIKINERMEVLNDADNPIPGLFGAGSTTGGWESDNYCYELSGHALGFALNSGRIAAENAIKYVANK